MTTQVNVGGSAFPQAWEAYPGMTLRDWYAGMAMQGFIAGLRGSVLDELSPQDAKALLVSESYGVADAMLEARS